jgi:hypothetical protein
LITVRRWTWHMLLVALSIFGGKEDAGSGKFSSAFALYPLSLYV